MTLRVRNLAAEVSQKEEMLAVLAERSADDPAESSTAPQPRANPAAGPERLPEAHAAESKMARRSRGRLGVKVISLPVFKLMVDNGRIQTDPTSTLKQQHPHAAGARSCFTDCLLFKNVLK